MTIKRIIFSLVMAIAFIAPNYASTNPGDDTTINSKALDEIKELIHDIEFDMDNITIKKVKIHFMMNSYNEVIVIQTNSKQIDSTIKSKLNYKKLKNRDLEVNTVYTLPVTFEKE